MKRRNFLGALAALPFVGKAAAAAIAKPDAERFIVCDGDSLTTGSYVSDGTHFRHGWFEQMVGKHKIVMLDYGTNDSRDWAPDDPAWDVAFGGYHGHPATKRRRRKSRRRGKR